MTLLGQCEALQALLINNNMLKVFPPDLGDLKNLKEFDFSNNRIHALPPEVSKPQTACNAQKVNVT